MLDFKNEKKKVKFLSFKRNELTYDSDRCICTLRVTSPSIVEQSNNW